MRTKTLAKALKKSDRLSRKKHLQIVLILFVCILILSYFLLTVGNTRYSLSTVISTIISGVSKGAGYTINKVRLPKLIIGGLTGFAFGVSGYTFQTLLRNPLASPDIIGISSGASAGAVFCILILGISGFAASIFSVATGILVTLLIFVLSQTKGIHSNNKMILIGIGIQAIVNALISWMLLVGSEYDVATALRWMRGSLNTAQMSDVPLTGIVIILCLSGLMICRRSLLILELGDEFPISLGVNVKRTKILSMLFALLLVAAATAVTGPIASVAFLSKPIAKRIARNSTDVMMLSGMIGIILVYAAELIGQNAFSVKYSVGIVTGLLGAPYLLILLISLNKKGSAI